MEPTRQQLASPGTGALPAIANPAAPQPQATYPAQPGTLIRDLETTTEVRLAAEESCKYFGLTRQTDRQRVEEELKLQFYYGGLDVAAVRTPKGQAILAAGTPEEVGKVLEQLTPDERRKVHVFCPAVWGTVDLPSVLTDET